MVALLRYVRRGYLYIFGGALIAAGGLAMLLEFLLNLTFGVHQTFFWSLLSAGRRGAAGGDADHHCRLSASAPLPSPEVLPVNSHSGSFDIKALLPLWRRAFPVDFPEEIPYNGTQ